VSHNDRVDPYAVLGVRPGSTESQVAAAYKDLAKRWHPDRGAGEEGERRMAEINAAYDVLRAGEMHAASPPPSPAAAGRGFGGWLAPWMRRALGVELLRALSDGEDVLVVTPASLSASPRAVLAVTERRLLWLLDDAPVARVRSLALRDVAHVEERRKRRHVSLSIRTHTGRRHVFHELRPHTAATIAKHVRPA
jgi:DnaJ-like protein